MSPSLLNKIENKEIAEELPGLLRRHSSSQPDGLLCNSIKESPDGASGQPNTTKDPVSITRPTLDRTESITDREMDEIQFNLRKREISKRRLTRMQSSRFFPPQTRLELLKEMLSALCSVVPHPEFGDAGPGLMVVAVAVLSIFLLLLAFKFGWYGWVFQRIWSSSR